MLATSSDSRAQRATSSLNGSTAALTVSASRMKSLMILFCPRRIAIVSFSSRRPGWARRITSLRSSGRPASPVPSSEMISRNRSL